MINDILFEKFAFDIGESWETKLTPPEAAWLRTSAAKAAMAQGGIQCRHVFSTSNQPLSASEATYLRDLNSRADGRPVLVQNPFSNFAYYPPQVNAYGSMMGGCIIQPRGSVIWQPALYFSTVTLEKLILKPVAYAENILIDGASSINFDFVTKSSSSLSFPQASTGVSEVRLCSFNYWLPMKISQLEISPLKNQRRLNLGSCENDYVATITLEEDIEQTLPVMFSWPSIENVRRN
jgi:hypothetical protein